MLQKSLETRVWIDKKQSGVQKKGKNTTKQQQSSPKKQGYKTINEREDG